MKYLVLAYTFIILFTVLMGGVKIRMNGETVGFDGLLGKTLESILEKRNASR